MSGLSGASGLAVGRRLRGRGFLVQALWSVARTPKGAICGGVLLIAVLVATAAPLVAPYDPNSQQVGPMLNGPSGAHLFGTDEFGRDVLSRVIYALRPSIAVSATAVLVAAAVGVLLGALAGYFRGPLDSVLMRTVDVLLAFPALMMGLVLVAIGGAGLVSVGVTIMFVTAPLFARLTRAEVLREKNMDYVMSAQLSGSGPIRVLFRHVLRNSLAPLLAQLAIAMSFAIALESAMSFLGLGVQPPTPSLGEMLNGGRTFLRDAPWLAIFPGLALAVLLVSLSFLADATRDGLDPKRMS